MKHEKDHQQSIVLPAGEGRIYQCGTMTAIFKADENETNEKYSVSEWWLTPHSEGPGAHQHEENDEVFYGLLNFYIPGGFEKNMPSIVKWFEEQQ